MPLRIEDLVGLGRRRAVGGLGHDLGLDAARVRGRDLVLERGRDEHVALDLEQLRVGHGLRAGEAGDRAVLGLPVDHARDVEAVGVVDAAGRVGDGEDLRALLRHQLRRDRAGVAEALDHDASRSSRSMSRCRAASSMQKTAPRAVASLRPSEPPSEIGLPVTTPGTVYPTCIEYVSMIQAIVWALVLTSGAGMSRSGPIRTSISVVKRRRQVLELAPRQLLGVDDDAALAAAERDADDRALPGHPHREGLDLVDRHVLVVADAALGRAATQVVLDAIAGEDLHGAVVHLHREVDVQLAARLAQHLAQARVQVEPFGGQVELLLRHLPRVDGTARLARWSWESRSSSVVSAGPEISGGRLEASRREYTPARPMVERCRRSKIRSATVSHRAVRVPTPSR